jgi:hypothetical protein
MALTLHDITVGVGNNSLLNTLRGYNDGAPPG